MDSGEMLDQIESVEDLATLRVDSPPTRAAIQKINYSHDGMINLILTNRGITQNALAQHFGYSASWISQVMSSDAFQARLAERAQEIEDPTLRQTIEDGFKGLVNRSIALLKEKLDKPVEEIEANLILRTLDISSRAAGYGAKPTVSITNTQVNVENHLEVQAQRLTGLLSRKKAELAPIEPVIQI